MCVQTLNWPYLRRTKIRKTLTYGFDLCLAIIEKGLLADLVLASKDKEDVLLVILVNHAVLDPYLQTREKFAFSDLDLAP